MELKDILEVINYKLAYADDSTLHAFGENAISLAFQDRNGKPLGMFVVKSTTSEVLEAYFVVPEKDLAYRWTKKDKALKVQKAKELARWEIDDAVAFDDDKGNPVLFVDLEVESDFLSKLKSVYNVDYEFDRRVVVPLNLTDEEFLVLVREAHEKDMTFNDFVAQKVENFVATVSNMTKEDFNALKQKIGKENFGNQAKKASSF